MTEVTQGGTGTRYYDQSGVIVKVILKMDAETVWFLANTPEHRLVATGHWTFFGVPGVNGGKQVGPIIHLVLPGVGTAFLDAGQVIFGPTGLVKIAGTHPIYDPAQMDVAALCAALQ